MDTQVNCNDAFVGRVFKGGKTVDGYLWATCGSAAAVLSARDWVERRKGDPIVPKGATLILVTPAGVVREWWPDDEMWTEHQAEYYAWGSGEKFALGALAVGATADEAVEAACRHDPWSSEPLLVELLEEPDAPKADADEGEALAAPANPDWREEMGLK